MFSIWLWKIFSLHGKEVLLFQFCLRGNRELLKKTTEDRRKGYALRQQPPSRPPVRTDHAKTDSPLFLFERMRPWARMENGNGTRWCKMWRWSPFASVMKNKAGDLIFKEILSHIFMVYESLLMPLWGSSPSCIPRMPQNMFIWLSFSTHISPSVYLNSFPSFVLFLSLFATHFWQWMAGWQTFLLDSVKPTEK